MSQSPSTPDQGSTPAGGDAKGPFGKLWLFLRQVIDELRKVVVPTRRELTNYTLVVLVFVVIVIGIVTGFDAVFSRGAEALFGSTGGGVEQPAAPPAGVDGGVED
ncbi:preprotein translocase subunit SecE [Nesterenkonia jeotgali]|uniref:preprotein translocase subunit SecE n=1 Tax=Nesterenkonia jeotgali TaxID=317018 RepID=UPI0009FADD2F|nr:preprotein translocase subunit SecE [Nesterenkonia jeotgali]